MFLAQAIDKRGLELQLWAVSLTLFPLDTLFCSLTSLFFVLTAHQACSHFRAFALAVPSACDILPSSWPTPSFRLYSDAPSTERPALTLCFFTMLITCTPFLHGLVDSWPPSLEQKLHWEVFTLCSCTPSTWHWPDI